MQTDETGRRFTEGFEGLSLAAYKDVAGIWTIGYGHTQGVKEGMTITQEQAGMLLAVDIQSVDDALAELVPADITQNQWNALSDFGFNLGLGALKIMLGHGWSEVPVQILRWDKAHVEGKMVPVAGLTRRRKAEADLFNK